MASGDHVPEWGCSPCRVKGVTDLAAADADAIVLVTDSVEKLPGHLAALQAPLTALRAVNAALDAEGAVVPVELPAKRLVFAPTGPLNRDYDDVRRFAEAAEKGIKRAIAAGSRAPLLVTVPYPKYQYSTLNSLLGALHALYVPIEVREHAVKTSDTKRLTKVDRLLVFGEQRAALERVIQSALGLESGRFVARDIGGSDPERMAAPRVAEYMQHVLKGSQVKIEVEQEDDSDTPFKAKYPLLAAVNRAAAVVPRHRARVIHLTYEGQGPITHTYMLVGKGITYDTGGLDIKAGGVMAGMHRDKCGAAAVGGFFKTLAELRPAGIKVIGVMCMVRNSVGADGYVADEIITSRAGVRIRVGNTDAEGRMVMADLLCLMKERAAGEVNPYLMTVATLTGHAVLACGDGYCSVLDNGPARLAHCANRFAEAGDQLGDPFEINTIRREDYCFHGGKSEYEDVLQCNNAPSSRTPRGHQGPAAFLVLASGLDKHGIDSDKPLRYSHLDIAAGSGPFPGVPTGSPILAMAANFFGNQL
ncbi:putative aminopeptidase W07G4.4 [Pollicipes pollicipes]|uniref:putative aminopeptidase W07G4.4 n=1 Tax=Pollicipes pollicipes TaxID=41117 RepID=UPI001884C704|nr:putative aminopeptidase W07G4.4 [Pollicipes pollicipes]XP_037088557.1 putative aminopeptidase W07G4.4 [Pollicipes pollicipes]XP_037088558.1 putative aminopeptidase W07G4.4 [Pollicipes pollicipes]XP_037088559.1 putative aminopeptidase W07G4.4 [Pollicipes pollicipes]